MCAGHPVKPKVFSPRKRPSITPFDPQLPANAATIPSPAATAATASAPSPAKPQLEDVASLAAAGQKFSDRELKNMFMANYRAK